MKYIFLTILMLPLLANAQCDSVKVSRLSLSIYTGNSSHDTDPKYLRRDNWSSKTSPVYPFIDPYSMWNEITVVSPETSLQLSYTFNHKEQRKWYQQVNLNVGLHGNVKGYSYGQFDESVTVDSIFTQETGTAYPVDSITSREITETYDLNYTALGLGYHLNYARGRFLFGFGAECSYYLMSDPSVSVTHKTTVSYAPNVYAPQSTTSYSEYGMEAKPMLFRAGIPITASFRLHTFNNLSKDNFMSRYANWWDEHFFKREKRSTTPGKYCESHLYLGYMITPTYFFGTFNGAVISRFGGTGSLKLTFMF